MEKANNTFYRLLPVAGVGLAFLALFGRGTLTWVQYSASAIGIILVIAWLFSETGWIGRAIKSKLFRPRLSEDHLIRLRVLLDDISNHMSYMYTLSPFYVWHDVSNRHGAKVRMNYSYHGAIHNWLNDLRDKFDNPRVYPILLISSLSKAVFEAGRLAGYVEQQLHDLLKGNNISEEERRKIQRDWEAARSDFNQWIDKCQTLFKEIEKATKMGGVHHIQPLGMIG